MSALPAPIDKIAVNMAEEGCAEQRNSSTTSVTELFKCTEST
jgi:hypothetical protein